MARPIGLSVFREGQTDADAGQQAHALLEDRGGIVMHHFPDDGAFEHRMQIAIADTYVGLKL